jgi:putative membrane protein
MARFFSGDGKAALTRAVDAFESATSAELVVAVRPRSDAYLHVNILVGVLAALVTTTFLLYGEPEFDLHWFIACPTFVGLAIGWSAGVPPLQRLLTRRSVREERVTRAARATFVERGVADTRGRTGVLLYISVAERVAVFVPDLGVRERVPQLAWDASTDAVRSPVARGGAASELAAPLTALGVVCGRHLPRGEDDVNELSDTVMS